MTTIYMSHILFVSIVRYV